MSLNQQFIAELKHESASTLRMLERVDMDRKDWHPDPKSMSLGRLATHVAEIPVWISRIVTKDDFDFASGNSSYPVAASKEELLKVYQESLDNALADLAKIDDAGLDLTWTVRRGEQVVYALPRKVAVRGWGLNHLIHHRGQLSVYLRLLGIPVPGMYGSSADERM